MCMVSAFIEVMSGKQKDVAQQLSDAYSRTIQRNRKVLKSIMATVEICGRQGLPLRGHRDDAHSLNDQNMNPGNFVALLHFRSQTDAVLAEFLENARNNATYLLKNNSE